MKKLLTLLALLPIIFLFTGATEQFLDTPRREKASVMLLDDFENSETWRIETTGVNYLTQIMKVVGCPAELRGDNKNEYKTGHKFVLGAKTEFREQRAAKVRIIPPKPIIIPGHCFNVSVWEQGRNVSHKLSLEITDFKGHLHSLLLTKIGDLDPNVLDEKGKPKSLNYANLMFKGWKKLETDIPDFVPQGTKYSAEARFLWITAFVLEQNPNEVDGEYCVYFDDLEAIVQKRESLESPDNVRDNWVK